MNEFQKRLLEILVFFHKFCDKHHLRYYAIDGTALGAMRHKGFIPWDDDIDVGMPRKDYERFKMLISEINGKSGYFAEFPCNKKDFVYTYGKLYDVNTTLIENTKYKTCRGLYLDIFPLDGVGNTKEEAIHYCKKINHLINLLCTRVCGVRKGRKWYKNLSVILSRSIPDFILDSRKIINKIDDLSKQRAFDSYEYVANISSRWHSKDIHLRETFGVPTLCEFEGINIFVPEKTDEYLTNLYGSWRKLPPMEKRVTDHDFIFCDMHTPYLEHQCNYLSLKSYR